MPCCVPTAAELLELETDEADPPLLPPPPPLGRQGRLLRGAMESTLLLFNVALALMPAVEGRLFDSLRLREIWRARCSRG